MIYNYFKGTNFDFDRFQYRMIKNIIYIDTYLIPEDICCPICGSTSISKNGHTKRKIKHCVYYTSPIEITIHLQNYVCRDCKNIFREKTDFANPNENISIESIFMILEKLKYSNETFESVARSCHLSRQIIIDVFDRYVEYTPPTLPQIISFDEKHINKKMSDGSYLFIIVDFVNKKLYDIVHSRRKNVLEKHFSRIPLEQRNQVKYITMDMWKTYKDLAIKYFKNAKIAVDSFHIVNAVNNAMNTIRKSVMQKYNINAEEIEDNSNFYYALKKYKYILLSDFNEINFKKHFNKKLNMWITKDSIRTYILDIDEKIKNAYSLSSSYIEFNKNTSYEKCEEDLDALIDKFLDSKLEPFIEVSKTLSTWKEYIINSFIEIKESSENTEYPKLRRLSNGPIEGINSILEKINVNGNGFSNFWRFRKRALYVVNKDLVIRNKPIREKYKK